MSICLSANVVCAANKKISFFLSFFLQAVKLEERMPWWGMWTNWWWAHQVIQELREKDTWFLMLALRVVSSWKMPYCSFQVGDIFIWFWVSLRWSVVAANNNKLQWKISCEKGGSVSLSLPFFSFCYAFLFSKVKAVRHHCDTQLNHKCTVT